VEDDATIKYSSHVETQFFHKIRNSYGLSVNILALINQSGMPRDMHKCSPQSIGNIPQKLIDFQT